MKRFRITKTDDIKAYVHSGRKLLASLYDSEFNSIKQIQSALISKIPYYSGTELLISIVNLTKGTSKDFKIKCNQ